VLYAKWTVHEYDITYDLDDGVISVPNPDKYRITDATITLNNPTKSGYVFIGWSGTDLIGNTNKDVKIAQGSVGDREYTAHWASSQAE